MFSSDLRYLSAFVALRVRDLDAAAEWYGAAFGFVVIARGTDRGSGWLHLRRSEGQDVVLTREEAAGGATPGGSALHLATDQSVWSLSDRARHVGAELMEPNGAEAELAGAATIRDPYGYEWVFFRRHTPKVG
jgi:uncharacterized glyoxalase superfamily protein PhnB